MMALRIIDMKIITALALCMTLLAGCYYDVEEKIYPAGCNTEDIRYSNVVLPIIQRECYTCHDALTQNGGVNLDGYDKLFEWVANGKVLSAIKHVGPVPMPQDAEMLDSCTIAKIEIWINAGALNN
jgi:hypothetical protein